MGVTAETATVGQVVALVEGRVRDLVEEWRVLRAIEDLARDGRIVGKKDDAGRYQLTAYEAYVLVGELVRRRAGWNKRANVRGGFEAWVVGDDLGDRIMLLPWDRGWDKVRGAETLTRPAVVPCVEFPTGRVTGQLVRGGLRGDVPVYEWQPVGLQDGPSAEIPGGVEDVATD